jgi:hypothetical protein
MHLDILWIIIAKSVLSNLMGTMASKIKSTWLDESAVISMKTFRDIGDLAFEQLSSLRHRGAFSTVSMTFARCCQLSQNKTSTELSRSALLELWYHVCCSYQKYFLPISDFLRVPKRASLSKPRPLDVPQGSQR